jgi:hypothetical protein
MTGFVYIWYDRKQRRYYIGCHWGNTNDGYICSSSWMKRAHQRRPQDFKRRILMDNIQSKELLYNEEQRFLNMIKPHELRKRYYNLTNSAKNLWHKYPEKVKTIGQKISISKTGKKIGVMSDAQKAAISAAKKGFVFTDEHRAKLAAAKRGRKSNNSLNKSE